MNSMKLSEKIPHLVKKQGISQAELARAIGTYPARVSEWVYEKGSPSIQQALRMAKVFNVTLDYLADDEQDEPPQSGMTEWEKRVWEIVRVIGPERAWRRLVGEAASYEVTVDSGGAEDASRQRRGSA